VKPSCASTVAVIIILGSASSSSVQAGDGGRTREPASRWSGSSELEYVQSDGSIDGQANTTKTFGQRYSLDLDTFIWDPRFCRASVGLDFLRRDTSSEGSGSLDSDALGYRLQTNLFSGRSFPLRLFARRTDLGIVGSVVDETDRQTEAWGFDGAMRLGSRQNLRAAYERSSSDLIGSLPLRERRSTGLADFEQRRENGDTTFHYGFQEQAELENGVRFTRHDLTLRDLERFDNGATFRVMGSRQLSDALYTTGERDELTTNRLSTTLDVPQSERTRYTIGYDFNQNDGKFLDNTNHGLRGQAQFRIASHWHVTGTMGWGRLRNRAGGATQQQDRAGASAGLRYGRDWSRFRLDTGYETGYTRESLDSAGNRVLTTHRVFLSGRLGVGAVSSVFSTVSAARDQNDVIDVGYAVDENWASLGWETRLGQQIRLRLAGTYRHLHYDTDNLGVQVSDEYGVELNLEHRVAGFSARYRSTDGVSDFFPQPGSGSIFLPGTDLVSRSNYYSIGAHWRLTPYLRAQMSALLDDRDFTSIGRERVVSYHPEIQYDRRTWRVAAGLSHYERTDGFEIVDDTWRLKITKLFF